MVKKVFISVSSALFLMAGMSCSNNKYQQSLEDQLELADSLIKSYEALVKEKDSLIMEQDRIINAMLSPQEKAERIAKYIEDHPLDTSVTGNEAPR